MTEPGPVESPTTDEGYSPATADGLLDGSEIEPGSTWVGAPEPVYAAPDPHVGEQLPTGTPPPAEELGYVGSTLPGDRDREQYQS